MYKQVPLVQSKNGYNVKSVQKYENLSLEPRSDNAVSSYITKVSNNFENAFKLRN
jgi:hypothetical protein